MVIRKKFWDYYLKFWLKNCLVWSFFCQFSGSSRGQLGSHSARSFQPAGRTPGCSPAALPVLPTPGCDATAEDAHPVAPPALLCVGGGGRGRRPRPLPGPGLRPRLRPLQSEGQPQPLRAWGGGAKVRRHKGGLQPAPRPFSKGNLSVSPRDLWRCLLQTGTHLPVRPQITPESIFDPFLGAKEFCGGDTRGRVTKTPWCQIWSPFSWPSSKPSTLPLHWPKVVTMRTSPPQLSFELIVGRWYLGV